MLNTKKKIVIIRQGRPVEKAISPSRCPECNSTHAEFRAYPDGEYGVCLVCNCLWKEIIIRRKDAKAKDA